MRKAVAARVRIRHPATHHRNAEVLSRSTISVAAHRAVCYIPLAGTGGTGERPASCLLEPPARICESWTVGNSGYHARVCVEHSEYDIVTSRHTPYPRRTDLLRDAVRVHAHRIAYQARPGLSERSSRGFGGQPSPAGHRHFFTGCPLSRRTQHGTNHGSHRYTGRCHEPGNDIRRAR